MSSIPGLRSTYAKVGRLVYFGRMLDKIRLHAAGRLPADYVPNLARGFDGRCCNFLGVKHAELTARVLQSGSDDEILAWCHQQGGQRTTEECEIWNNFMMKRGWRDGGTETLQTRIKESKLEGKGIETFFDLIEFDAASTVVPVSAGSMQLARLLQASPQTVRYDVVGRGRDECAASVAEPRLVW